MVWIQGEGYKRNLTNEILTFYRKCFDQKPFPHFATLYDTLGVEEDYNPEKGVHEEDAEAIASLIKVNPGRLKSVLSDEEVTKWKICASDTQKEIDTNYRVNYERHEKRRQWICITKLLEKYLRDGKHPPIPIHYQRCYAQCDRFDDA
nr:unnamed protein product [Callosobruchus analis]